MLGCFVVLFAELSHNDRQVAKSKNIVHLSSASHKDRLNSPEQVNGALSTDGRPSYKG